jgi:hypothetical protein
LAKYAPNELSEKINQLKGEKISVTLNSLVSDYSDASVDKFTQNGSVNLFKKLEESQDLNADFKLIMSILKEIILEKFRNEIKIAHQIEMNESLNAALRYLRRFEAAVKYLPADIKNMLEIELEHCKIDLAKQHL